MPVRRVLSVARSDRESNSYVLVQVTYLGPQRLDLSLLATEDTNPYVGNVRTAQLNTLRAKSYRGDDEEWDAVLAWAILRERPQTNHAEFVGQAELVAAVNGEQEIILTLRQTVSGITQRLGTISLKRDDNQEIDLFSWTGLAATMSIEVEREVTNLQACYDAQQKTVEKLNSQLYDLIRAKQKHEDEMLEKFRQLLNSKKAKIRDQMRLLATAKVDGNTATSMRDTRSSTRSKVGGDRTRSKRKAEESLRRNGSEDGVEPQMAREATAFGHFEGEEDVERAQTPARSDSETTDEEGYLPAHATSQIKEAEHNKQLPVRAGTANEQPSPLPQQLPPRRELPFSERVAAKSEANISTLASARDEDQDDTDDEL